LRTENELKVKSRVKVRKFLVYSQFNCVAEARRVDHREGCDGSFLERFLCPDSLKKEILVVRKEFS